MGHHHRQAMDRHRRQIQAKDQGEAIKRCKGLMQQIR